MKKLEISLFSFYPFVRENVYVIKYIFSNWNFFMKFVFFTLTELNPLETEISIFSIFGFFKNFTFCFSHFVREIWRAFKRVFLIWNFMLKSLFKTLTTIIPLKTEISKKYKIKKKKISLFVFFISFGKSDMWLSKLFHIKISCLNWCFKP